MVLFFRCARSTGIIVVAALQSNQYQLKNLLSYSTRPLYNSGPNDIIPHFYGEGLKMDGHTCKVHGWQARHGKENIT
jgi:beta-1,4-mannosyl-glycoprotein beta-1,4-N-acetylglucosaminyltransferase